MHLYKSQKGFTLVELLISVAVFAIFLVSVITVMVDMQQGSRRINLEEQVYQDMRAMMKQITGMISENAIDYEEYYRVAVGGGSKYGENYGDYQKAFYDFGSDGQPGVFCNDLTNTPDTPGFENCFIDKNTIDRNMGQYPPDGEAASDNALCAGCIDPDAKELHVQDQLYLINERGNKKTFLVLEDVDKEVAGATVNENVIAIAWLNGEDTDGNDIADVWTLGDEFYGSIQGLHDDIIASSTKATMYENFIPISPVRTNITGLQFYINPLEDPYKGFAENDPSVMQPSVTIIMTAEPSATVLQDYRGAIPQKTIQTTIFSDIRSNVESY